VYRNPVIDLPSLRSLTLSKVNQRRVSKRPPFYFLKSITRITTVDWLLAASVSVNGRTDRQTHIRTPLYGSYRAMRRRYSRVVKKIGDSFTYACLDKSKMDSDIRCYTLAARSGGIVAHYMMVGGTACTVPYRGH